MDNVEMRREVAVMLTKAAEDTLATARQHFATGDHAVAGKAFALGYAQLTAASVFAEEKGQCQT